MKSESEDGKILGSFLGLLLGNTLTMAMAMAIAVEVEGGAVAADAYEETRAAPRRASPGG